MKRNTTRAAKAGVRPRNSGLNDSHRIVVKAMTDNQDIILKSERNLVIHGYAGTGKSYLALDNALRALKERPKIKIIRSAVATRDIGHLPGSYEEKIEKYEAPYKTLVNKLHNGCGTAYESMKKAGIITFDTTSYIRGENWSDCTVVVDECQNMTFQELDSIITRGEDNAVFYFLGDCAQADLKNNGFGQFIKVLNTMKGSHFDYVEMTQDDIVRGAMMKAYIIAKTKIS